MKSITVQRTFAAFLALIAFVATLSGCKDSADGAAGASKKAGGAAAEIVTIRYARWGQPDEVEAERKLLDLFEQQNPGIKVVAEFNAWSEYWNKLQAQMAAKSAPDVFLLNGSHVHDYASRGQLEDLQPWIANDPSFKLEEYFPATVQVFRDGQKLWAAPRDCNTVAIYYNKSLFDKHKVPYPQPGWTWDDFLAKARALTKDEDKDGRTDTFGYLAGFDSMDVQWISWVWQNGGSVLDADRKKCLLDTPESIGGIQFLVDLVRKEKVSPDTAQTASFGSNMFLTGKLAMSSEGSWMLRSFSRIDGFQWDVAPMPKGKLDVANVNGLGNALYAGSKQKEAAWKLLRFLSSQAYQEALATSGTSIPALRSVATSPIYLDGKPSGKTIFLKQLETGRVLDFSPGFSKWDDAVRRQLELVWLGKKTVPDALKQATADVDAILAKEAVTK